MKHIIALAITLPLLALALPGCDSPDNEAELQALDIENDVEVEAAKAAEVLESAEDVQGSPASGLDTITNAPHSVAALPNQLCRTNADAKLFTSPNTYQIIIPANSLVRILDYRGDWHYLARYAGKVGQLERSKVIQSSCYFQ